MNYRNLRHVIGEGWGGGTPRRLVLSIEGVEGGETGGAGGDPAPDAGDTGDAPAGDEGGAGEGDQGETGAAPAAAAPEGAGETPEPTPKPTRVPWQTKRIDSLTAEKKAAEERAAAVAAEAAETKRQLAAYQALYGTEAVPGATPAAAAPAAAPAADGAPRTYTEEEVQGLVAHRAKLQTIDQTLNSWYDEGKKTEGDAFVQRHQAVGQAFGDQLVKRVDFYEALTSLPNGKDVYDALAGDLDHFADVLTMTPLQLGLELGRLSTAAAKPAKGPVVSKVPAPITPVDGTAGKDFDPDTASMEEYAKHQEARRAARFAERGY